MSGSPRSLTSTSTSCAIRYSIAVTALRAVATRLPQRFKQSAKNAKRILMVVDYQNTYRACPLAHLVWNWAAVSSMSHETGSFHTEACPFPGPALSAWMLPPCKSTIALQIVSPMPRPPNGRLMP